ncbi:hypothetical protein ACFY84_11550 [Streptomyces sp. NPDC012438]|uniref:hypothetical protein n=1 Tax=Streptomyces sp. NPDC012438 TaxID=3364833 RepID=UPI0036E53625
MRVLLVLDHPRTLAWAGNVPHRRGFTAAVAAAAVRGATAAGHEVDVNGLASDGSSTGCSPRAWCSPNGPAPGGTRSTT